MCIYINNVKKHIFLIVELIQTISLHPFCTQSHFGETSSATFHVMDAPRGQIKRVRFSGDSAVQELRKCVEDILEIWESEELAEEAICLGHMVSSDAPLYLITMLAEEAHRHVEELEHVIRACARGHKVYNGHEAVIYYHIIMLTHG